MGIVLLFGAGLGSTVRGFVIIFGRVVVGSLDAVLGSEGFFV